jgi:hypothetical protein
MYVSRPMRNNGTRIPEPAPVPTTSTKENIASGPIEVSSGRLHLNVATSPISASIHIASTTRIT